MMFIHYIMYKIRIMCTDTNELVFNEKKNYKRIIQ